MINDSKGKKIFKTIVLISLLALPTILFYFFIYTGVHKVNRLPFYGPIVMIDKMVKGNLVKDTSYFQLPSIQLLKSDSLYFNPKQLERKIHIAHFLDFSKLDTIPNQIILCVSEIFKKHPDIYIISYLEHYKGQAIPKPSSFTALLNGKDSLWLYVIVPDAKLDSIKKNGYFIFDPDVKEAPDPYSMALVDKEQRIRGYYNPTWISDIKRINSETAYLKKEYILNYRTHKYYEYDNKVEQKKLKNKKK